MGESGLLVIENVLGKLLIFSTLGKVKLLDFVDRVKAFHIALYFRVYIQQHLHLCLLTFLTLCCWRVTESGVNHMKSYTYFVIHDPQDPTKHLHCADESGV
jgi:hypothetical protein